MTRLRVPWLLMPVLVLLLGGCATAIRPDQSADH